MKKTNKLIIVITIILEITSESYAGFYYTNLESANLSMYISNSPLTIAFAGHVMYGKLCGENKKYYCIDQNIFILGIPNENEGNINKSWNFKKKKKEIRKFFGVEMQIEKIDFVNDNGTRVSYWYSSDYGIQAIYFKVGADSSYFLSNSRCGYGAKSVKCIKKK